MRVHLVGICGTGMGSLAALFKEAGHEVQGSDVAFDPPTGPALAALGVRCLEGYHAKNLQPAPDLVVVGNAIRRDNPEASAAEALALPRTSMSAALRDYFLQKRRPFVVTGTHGKTTTSAMAATILLKAGLQPGWFIGGRPKSLPSSAALGRTQLRLALGATGGAEGIALLPGHFATAPAPFVVEGDEYDAVYWNKKPKFLDYLGVSEEDVAILTSIEQDHIDIYPTVEAYENAFRDMVRSLPEDGLVVADAQDPRVRALVEREARCRVTFYALEGEDTGSVTPTWLAAPVGMENDGHQFFDLYVGGMSCGRYSLPVPGRHNVRNATAAMAACSEGFGVPVTASRSALAQFEGVARRQDLLGTPGGVRVYDDFAHHPTAVHETLRALRNKHAVGRLIAVFEPRSATSCRALHQQAYADAFSQADHVVLAPLGRSNIPPEERLDTQKLATDLGPKAKALESIDAIVNHVNELAEPGDTVAVLSNGHFGGIHQKLLQSLEKNTL